MNKQDKEKFLQYCQIVRLESGQLDSRTAFEILKFVLSNKNKKNMFTEYIENGMIDDEEYRDVY